MATPTIFAEVDETEGLPPRKIITCALLFGTKDQKLVTLPDVSAFGEITAVLCCDKSAAVVKGKFKVKVPDGLEAADINT